MAPDVVVVGAGAGGLAAAVRLAAAGRRVLVLEQDRHVGGTAHVFRRGGFVFPAGPLSFTAPRFLSATLRDLGVTARIALGRDLFQVRRSGLDIMVSVPLDRVAAQLDSAFPAEREGIGTVIGVLSQVIRALRVMDAAAGGGGEGGTPAPSRVSGATPSGDPEATPSSLIGATAMTLADAREVLSRWEGVPGRDLIDGHLRDHRLRDLLGSQGTSETVMPVLLLARMWDFMAEQGIWYPRDGIDVVGRLLAERLRVLGGDLWLGARVERVLVEAGRAAGVELADGRRIQAEAVVSDADYRHTMLSLVADGDVDPQERAGIARVPLTGSDFTVFLGVDARSVDLSAFRGHQLLVKQEEGGPIPWAQKREVEADFARDELWLCWWSRHDPALAPPGHEALVIKVSAPFGPFLPLDGEGRLHHLPRYYAWKEQMADAVVKSASAVIPGLDRSLVVREVATPLTYRDWGHRSEGSVAGWSWRAEDLPAGQARSLVCTPVAGLFAVGLQSYTRLFLGGLGTSLYSGLEAAREVLEAGS